MLLNDEKNYRKKNCEKKSCPHNNFELSTDADRFCEPLLCYWSATLSHCRFNLLCISREFEFKSEQNQNKSRREKSPRQAMRSESCATESLNQLAAVKKSSTRFDNYFNIFPLFQAFLFSPEHSASITILSSWSIIQNICFFRFPLEMLLTYSFLFWINLRNHKIFTFERGLQRAALSFHQNLPQETRNLNFPQSTFLPSRSDLLLMFPFRSSHFTSLNIINNLV